MPHDKICHEAYFLWSWWEIPPLQSSYLLLSDYCHNKLAYSALLNNIDIIVIISYNVILFENKDFMGPSEKFRGWGKPIQSAKYRN